MKEKKNDIDLVPVLSVNHLVLMYSKTIFSKTSN